MRKFLVVFSLLFVISCNESEINKEKPVIKIGIELPLSGNIAFAGESAREAMLMEFEKIKATKELKYNYELIFEDVGLSVKTAAVVANKLINVDKINAIISMWSLAGNTVAPIAEQYKIPSFTSSYGEQSTKGKYNFNINPSFEDVADLMSEQLLENNIGKVALFIENAGGNQEVRDALIASFKEYKIDIVFDELLNPGTKDFRLAIKKSIVANPQIYIVIGVVPTPYVFVKQLKEVVGEDANVTSIDSFTEMPPHQAKMANNKWLIDTGTFGNDEFVKELKEKKNVQAYSNSGTMATNIIIVIDAFENAISENTRVPTGEEILDWVWNNIKDYDTPVGKVTIVNNGLIKNAPVVKKIVDGIPITVK